MTPKLLFSLLLFAVFAVQEVFSLEFEMRFKGGEFISYDLRSSIISTETNHISLQFKTFHPSGLILHTSGTQGDFITLELIHSKLRLTINLGNTQTVSGTHDVILGQNLADNQWHTFKLTHNYRLLHLTLDGTLSTSTTAGSFERLDLDKFIFVGGVDRSLPDEYHGAREAPNFKGCLRDVYFDFIDILHGAQYEYLNYRTQGTPEYACIQDTYVPVGFPTPSSHLRLIDVSPNNFTIRLSFRTYSGDGVLAFKMSSQARAYLSLVGGKMELEIRIGVDQPIKISLGEHLNDGMWHDVTSGVNRNELWLTLDDKPEVRHANPWLNRIGRFRERTYVGSGTQKTGFVGCMNNIKMNGVFIKPKALTSEVAAAVIGQCSINSRCFPNPCLNGGVCRQTWEKYTCDCQGTFYEGNKCQIPLYRSTCEEYKALGITEDSYCKVDPDGKGPLSSFEVTCNMTGNEARTVLTHDKQIKQKVTDGANNYHGFYFHRITYMQDLASIRALVEKSQRCRQYISFNCYKSKILNAPNGPANAQWLSRTGVLQSYWGGAPADKNICACGAQGTCADPLKYCNCDIGDAVWREDAGYLTDKNALPVNMLQFTDDAAQSYFTLGPLECFGFNGKPVARVTSDSIVSAACRLVNPPPTEAEPSLPPYVPTAWNSKGSPKNKYVSTPRTTAKSSGIIPTPRPPNSHGHVTVTTIISTHDNSTLVTSVLKHKTKNGSKDGLTIHSSISSDKSGLTIHNTITTKGKTVTLPPVGPSDPTGYPPQWNSSIAHVTRVTEYEYSEKFIILVVASVIALILLVVVVVILLLRRTGRTYIPCAMCKRCRNKRSIPDIEIYRHSMHSDSPDVLQLDDMRPTSVELGAYNVRNGQAVYHSVHHTGSVKKFVSFSSSTSKI